MLYWQKKVGEKCGPKNQPALGEQDVFLKACYSPKILEGKTKHNG